MKCKYCDGEAKRHGTRKRKTIRERVQIWLCPTCKRYFTYGYKQRPIERGLFFDFSLGYVIGVLVGDGSIIKYQDYYYFNDKFQHVKKAEATKIVPRVRHMFQLQAKDKEFVQEFANHLGKIVGRTPKLHPITVSPKSIAGNPTPNYTFHGFKTNLRSKEWYNKLKPMKDNLNWIKKAPKEVKRGFLRGMYDSEGGAYRRDYGIRIRLTNKNIDLLELVRMLLIEFGLNIPNKMNTNKAGISNLAFGLSDNIDLFYETVGFTIKRKKRANLKPYQ